MAAERERITEKKAAQSNRERESERDVYDSGKCQSRFYVIFQGPTVLQQGLKRSSAPVTSDQKVLALSCVIFAVGHI